MFKRIQINKDKLTFARPSVFFFPAACLSVCPSISVCLCISLPRDIYLPICPSFLFVSTSISVWSLFVCLSVCASICVSVCLSICLSVCLFVCQSVFAQSYSSFHPNHPQKQCVARQTYPGYRVELCKFIFVGKLCSSKELG